jgi:hypothetical protein
MQPRLHSFSVQLVTLQLQRMVNDQIICHFTEKRNHLIISRQTLAQQCNTEELVCHSMMACMDGYREEKLRLVHDILSRTNAQYQTKRNRTAVR